MRKVDDVVARISAATRRDRTLIAARQGRAMEPAGDQLQALLDLAAALDDAGIPYALIGGIAVGIHSAQPRATVDVDVAVTSNVARPDLIEALSRSGFDLTGEFAHSLNFRHASGEPVQVSIDPPFDPMIDRAETVSVGDSSVCIIGKFDLIASKERAAADPGRRRSKVLRDEADIALLRGDAAGPNEGW